MSQAAPPRTTDPADWRKLYALGLPPGSVRAGLAILIFATTWALLVAQPHREVPDYLRDLLFIIMGHYFASRRQAAPGAEAGPPPLWLPKGSVRLILVIGTAAVAAVLHRRGRLTDVGHNPGVETLLLVGGFLLGVVLNAVYQWWTDRGHRPPRLVEDVRALLASAAAVALVALVVNTRLAPLFPREGIDALFSGAVGLGRFGPEHLLAAFVGFYFGSRS